MGIHGLTAVRSSDFNDVEADITCLKFCVDLYNETRDSKDKRIKTLKILETLCLIISGSSREEFKIISENLKYVKNKNKEPLLKKVERNHIPEVGETNISSYVRGIFDRTGFLIAEDIFTLPRIEF